MTTNTAAFDTERLRVREWHTASLPTGIHLAEIVSEMLTPAVTQPLPETWHGDYTIERAEAWINERDHEGTTLLVTDHASGDPVGLVILAELPAADSTHAVDLRLGFLLAETTWGHGLASELIEGLINWCRSQPSNRSIASGVSLDNPASARVLAKNGFAAVGDTQDGQQIYKLSLDS